MDEKEQGRGFMLDKKDILQLTDQLISYNEEADRIYESVRKEGAERDFFTAVKPFADEVHSACSLWNEQMTEWMKTESFRHLYPMQIQQTADNLSDVAVQAFFPKTSYKRFKSHVQSVRFILQNVRDEAASKTE